MPLNEMGKNVYYCSVLDPKGKIFFNGDTKIKEYSVEVRALLLVSEKGTFRKITMPKSINH